MKKYITPIILLLGISIFLFSCAGGQKKKEKLNGVRTYGFNGRVKSVKETQSDAVEKFGEVVKGNHPQSVTETLFNKGGYLISVTNLTVNRDINFLHREDTSLSYTKQNYSYIGDSVLVEMLTTDSAGNLLNKHSYKRNGTGRVAEENEFDKNGKLISKVINLYNDKGSLLSANSYNGDGTPQTKFISDIDGDGKVKTTTELEFKDGEAYYKTICTYDKNEKLIESASYHEPEDKSPFDSKYKYDDKGNEIGLDYIDGDNKKGQFATKYEFDKQGNWTKKIEYIDNDLQRYTERIIEYY